MGQRYVGRGRKPEPPTDSQVLTWELQFKRDGTLPPAVQEHLLRVAAERATATRWGE